MVKTSLFGKALEELRQEALVSGMPKYIGDQIAGWLYRSSVVSFEEMTNISQQNRLQLTEHYSPGLTSPVREQVSADGTRKYLFPVGQQKFIETAFMPEKARNTVCISTQVGCKMGCLFCMTGKQGFGGNLSAGEILNQVRSLPERSAVSNIVYMGMGEPFDNTEEVIKSLFILNSQWGFGISPRKVTVSTVGIIPGMKEFLEKTTCNLAISLHSPFDEERKYLMPAEHAFPIKDIIKVLSLSGISRYRKITFEYILFSGVNDSIQHVNELVRLLNKVKCRINLMHFHFVPGTPLKGSDEITLRWFRDKLNDKGITATIRHSRGLDIDAACGLLSTKTLMSKMSQGNYDYLP